MRDAGLLTILLVCHYLGDFCLTSGWMIRAKSEGRRLLPILAHAGVHAGLMGVCILFFGVEIKLLLILMTVELVTHFVIDTLKGRITSRFSKLSDQKEKAYWMLYGFDQLLHLMVIVGIWYTIIKQ